MWELRPKVRTAALTIGAFEATQPGAGLGPRHFVCSVSTNKRSKPMAKYILLVNWHSGASRILAKRLAAGRALAKE